MSYQVTFERIGRDHNAEPIMVPDGDADEIAYHIYTHVRTRLASSDVEVGVNLDEQRGTIFCGFHNGGNFTLEPFDV